jgi:glucosamine-phosphate N-acetyltransferase
MADDFEVRPLKAKDFHNGYVQLLSQLTTVGKLNEAEFIKQLTYFRSLPETYFPIVAANKTDKKIIAASTLFIERKFIHNCGSIGHIEDVVVSKDYRGTGLGKILITKLIKIAREMKCYKIILNCQEKNIPFYEKCGFTKKEVEMALYFNQENNKK